MDSRPKEAGYPFAVPEGRWHARIRLADQGTRGAPSVPRGVRTRSRGGRATTRRAAEANIRRLCFRREGLLYSEFSHIFAEALGARSPLHQRILRTLAQGDKSLSGVARALGTGRSGVLGRYLHNLEVSGFTRKHAVYRPGHTAPSRLHKYRIVDCYSRFYLRHVDPVLESIRQGLFSKVSLDRIIRWEVILGLQFENLVLDNLRALLCRLDLDESAVTSAAPYHQRRTTRQDACQIDILLQTKHAVYPCEVRCRSRVDRTVVDDVKRKIGALKIPRGLSIRPVLVHEGQLDPAIAGSGFFDDLVGFQDLLSTVP